MYIAQPEVAGEGEAHPAENKTPDVSPHECDTRNLPHMTLRAHQRALSMATLPLRARCALAAIALTSDCRRPLKEIFAHRDYLANRAGLSERTWYRAEADLVQAGLITINEQGRKAHHGRFGSAYIYLTESAATMLGLIGSPIATRNRSIAVVQEKADNVAKREDQPAAGCETPAQQEHGQSDASFVPPSANMADPYTSDFYQSPSFQKRQPGTLPRDLERLLSLGFHKNLVFKLMKEARLAGKFLSDVVESCWTPLKKAHAPIAYLRALLAKSIDFTFQARHRRVDDQSKIEQTVEHDELAHVIRDNAGKSFIDCRHNLVVVLSETGDSAEVSHADESRPRYAAGNALLDLARGIRSGQLQPRLDAGNPIEAVRFNSPVKRDEGRRDNSVSLAHARLMRDLLKRSTFLAA